MRGYYLLLAALSGGLLGEIFRWFSGKRGRFIQDAERVVGLFRTEIDRLSSEINELKVLVSALEGEVIFLGGDPHRVRADVARRLGDHG